MPERNADIIRELWEEHKAAPFPKGFSGMDISGIDFVMLDADIAGCISVYLERGALDVLRTAILGVCYRDASYILPILNEEGAAYFWRLERMAELLLKTIRATERPTA